MPKPVWKTTWGEFATVEAGLSAQAGSEKGFNMWYKCGPGRIFYLANRSRECRVRPAGLAAVDPTRRCRRRDQTRVGQ